MIREAILTKLGKNIDNVKKRCAGKPLSINIAFFLHKTTHTKKDLDNLSSAVVKILGEAVISKKDNQKGLEIISNVNLIYRIILEKNLIEKDMKEEFLVSIYEWG